MYRIIDGGSVFIFDATTEGGFNHSGRSTDRPLYSGETSSDHYVQEPTTFTINAILSDFKIFSSVNQESSVTVLERLIELQRSGRRFSVEVIKDSTLIYDNCLFESIDVRNDNTKYGAVETSGVSFYSFSVSIRVKQIKAATRGRIVTESNISDTVSSKKQGSGVNSIPASEREAESNKTKMREAQRRKDRISEILEEG